MIDLDNGPLAMLLWILVVYLCPFIYSFFIDKYDKNTPKVDTYSG